MGHVRDEIKERFPTAWEQARSGHSRQAAIRLFCFECCGCNLNEVKLCTDVTCPLYPYRMHTATLANHVFTTGFDDLESNNVGDVDDDA